jgi:hypothetical protein
LSVWQIGTFVITALLTIMIVQSLTAMMRDWLMPPPQDHRHTPTLISYSEPRTSQCGRQKLLWAPGRARVWSIFSITAVLNHQGHGQL